MSLVNVRCVCGTVEVTSTFDIHIGVSIGRVIGVVFHSLVVFDLVKVPCYSILTTVFILRLP